MCAIVGCIMAGPHSSRQANDNLNIIFKRSIERGRDGYGWRVNQDGQIRDHRCTVRGARWYGDYFDTNPDARVGTLIANLRAEPTTEYVENKQAYDQQPYSLGPWTIVHNGTIANDHELRLNEGLPTSIDSAAIVELLARDEMRGLSLQLVGAYFERAVRALKGSYAILCTHDDHPGVVFSACNYRPIWWACDGAGSYFASARHYFPSNLSPVMQTPYSVWQYDANGGTRLDMPAKLPGRALVVCSGGLDSVVAATVMKTQGIDVHLLHFEYGSRAEVVEHSAVIAVAQHLDVPVHFVPMRIYDPADSPLLRADSTIAGGEEGAEFAHEWVPARNLVMLSLATAYAEAGGFDTIVLGNNLEEAGAYPDNEPEFIDRFNDLLPFAVGDGKRVRVVMPVGNLMKHEIVALGQTIGAPLHLTWSCYRAGPIHCGTCGPCFMRRTAFEINKLDEVIQYADKGE